MAKVSIIVPVYNPPEQYFKICCQSLLNQTYQDFEIILINNAAVGNIPNLIQKYSEMDSRIKTYTFKKNVGFSGACNKGLELATGDYVQIVDSDDYLVPNALAIENDTIHSTNSDIIIYNHSYFDHKTNTESINKFPIGITTKQKENFKLDETTSWIFDISMCAWNKLFKREFLLNNNLKFDTDISVAAPDVLMSVKSYLLAEKISYITDALYCYRINLPNNVMAKLSKKGVELYKSVPLFCNKVDNFVLENNINPNLLPYIIKLNLVMLTTNFKRTHKSNRKDFYYLIQDYFKKNKELYQKKNLSKCDRYYKQFFKQISKRPYWLFVLINTLYKKEEINNVKRIKIFNISIYKRWIQDGYINIRFLGFLKTKKFDITSWFNHSINIMCTKAETQQDLLQKSLNQLDEQKQIIDNLNKKISNLKTIIEAQKIHPESFGPYKNAFAGKDVVLVCTGPSVKNYKPIDNAIHIGVNGAIYLDQIKLDYLFVQDYTINQKGNEQLVEDCYKYDGNNCKKFFGIIPDGWETAKPVIERIPLRFSFDKNVAQYIIEDSVGHNIAYDLSREPIGDFCGTVFSALQFILYTNPKRLFLVGWDCSAGYAYNKKNAIMPADYQKKIVKDYFIPYIKINNPDLEIISINPAGLKGMFKDQYNNNEVNNV